MFTRAGADFADMSSTLLTSAMKTGNPYVMLWPLLPPLFLLLAILNAIFGGGGDGNGDGKVMVQVTHRKGSANRNSGAANPSRQPDNLPVSKPGEEGWW